VCFVQARRIRPFGKTCLRTYRLKPIISVGRKMTGWWGEDQESDPSSVFASRM
jgi:hypothetical protein